MLKELAETVATAVGQLSDVDRVLDRAGRATDLQTRVDQAIEDFSKIVAFRESASELGVIDPSEALFSKTLVSKLSATMADGIAAHGLIGLDPSDASRLRAEMNSTYTDARERAAGCWHRYCAEFSPPEVPDAFLEVFREIAPESADELESHLTTCRQHRETSVPGRSSMIAYQKAVAAIPIVLREFADDPAIQAFVEAVGSGGAELSEVTPKVRDWMAGTTTADGRSLETLFRVVLKRTNL